LDAHLVPVLVRGATTRKGRWHAARIVPPVEALLRSGQRILAHLRIHRRSSPPQAAASAKRRQAAAQGHSLGTEIRVLMSHPMTTAQSGQPLHFIQNVTVKLNGRAVIEAEVSQAVSRNPVFSFRLKGGAKGDRIEVAWLDNQGESNRIETAVA
jgi:sulfur-oxidizing protein SoxZ